MFLFLFCYHFQTISATVRRINLFEKAIMVKVENTTYTGHNEPYKNVSLNFILIII